MALEYFLIAELGSAINENGYISVKMFSDIPDRLFKVNSVFLEVDGVLRELILDDVVLQDENRSMVKFRRFDSFEDAEFLSGRKIFLPSVLCENSDEESYFVHDIVGSLVFRNDRFYGIIEEVFSAPANDVYAIKKADGSAEMLPAIKDFIVSFDPVGKKMILKPGEDSFYDDED